MERLNETVGQISLTDPAFPMLSADQLLELEKIYNEMGENSLDQNLCREIAENFSAGNQTSLSWEKVHLWFRNKLDESQDQVASAGAMNQLVDLYDTPILRTGSSTVREDLEWAFEARSKKDLAWHDVATLINFRNWGTDEAEVCVRYLGLDRVEDEWVNAKNDMRRRSIPLEPSECHNVKHGDLVLCFLERDDCALYFDARVVRVQRRLHDATDCKCIFTVRFLHDNSEESVHWEGVCYRPTQEQSTVGYNFREPTMEPTTELNRPTQEECTLEESTEEESVGCNNSQEPTKEPSLSDIENLWPENISFFFRVSLSSLWIRSISRLWTM